MISIGPSDAVGLYASSVLAVLDAAQRNGRLSNQHESIAAAAAAAVAELLQGPSGYDWLVWQYKVKHEDGVSGDGQ